MSVICPRTEGAAASGEVTWHERGFAPSDLDDAWYVIAATDVRAVNEEVSRAAEECRVFCVRSDDATRASAWTPAVGRHAGVTVAVLGNRQPQRSAAVRDEIVSALRDGVIDAEAHRDRTPGVVLVGGGPGDPELVTVAARNRTALDTVLTRLLLVDPDALKAEEERFEETLDRGLKILDQDIAARMSEADTKRRLSKPDRLPV